MKDVADLDLACPSTPPAPPGRSVALLGTMPESSEGDLEMGRYEQDDSNTWPGEAAAPRAQASYSSFKNRAHRLISSLWPSVAILPSSCPTDTDSCGGED